MTDLTAEQRAWLERHRHATPAYGPDIDQHPERRRPWLDEMELKNSAIVAVLDALAEAREREQRVRDYWLHPVEPNSFYVNGFMNRLDQLAELFSSTAAANLRSFLGGPQDGEAEPVVIDKAYRSGESFTIEHSVIVNPVEDS